jgi:hypothetical protein
MLPFELNVFSGDVSFTFQLKSKEDPELERKCGEWIEDILGSSFLFPAII